MDLQQLTKNVFYYPHNAKYDRPTLGYIKGEKYSLMVDAGTSKRHVDEFNLCLDNKQLSLPDFVVITHWHWDHTYAMKAVSGLTIAHEKTNEKLLEMMQWQWTIEAMQKRLETGVDIEFADTHIKREYQNLSEIELVKSDISFDKNLQLDLGSMKIALIHTQSPHSEDSVLVYVEQEKILFVGDAISVDYYNNNYLDMKKLRSLIKTIEGLEFDFCVLGHAEPQSKQAIVQIMQTLLKQ